MRGRNGKGDSPLGWWAGGISPISFNKGGKGGVRYQNGDFCGFEPLSAHPGIIHTVSPSTIEIYGTWN